ncbi:MAG TPA: flavodoxin domain-containing protein [Caldisericia bacterium]|nr:flavodoxin domain-containing protein [Caldisericia bacterium]HPF48444.1 flavodoxin domain-containing protein [Caldisericia bacterium]HPI83376.1 flavodoxin domain-containing protein [Caldisericia bacterium]HPQ92898.1 flavodoxin domain-containing protein [Caldisericia bacterium]HRV74004.1 flavodoxin domain-containing protein [Caldisericia bacterium]
MKTLIVYAGFSGTSRECADILSQELSGETSLVDLAKSKKVDLSKYDTIALGGSVRMGKIHKAVKHFIENNAETLMTKNLGIFMCCASVEDYAKQRDDAFPKELQEHAVDVAHFGAKYNWDNMNFFIRSMMKKMTKDTQEPTINQSRISDFAKKLSENSR